MSLTLERVTDAAGDRMDPNTLPAGWYWDPNSHDIVRYWNGSAWTEARVVPPAEGQSAIPPTPRYAAPNGTLAWLVSRNGLRIAGAVLVVVGLALLYGSYHAQQQALSAQISLGFDDPRGQYSSGATSSTSGDGTDSIAMSCVSEPNPKLCTELLVMADYSEIDSANSTGRTLSALGWLVLLGAGVTFAVSFARPKLEQPPGVEA